MIMGDVSSLLKHALGWTSEELFFQDPAWLFNLHSQKHTWNLKMGGPLEKGDSY